MFKKQKTGKFQAGFDNDDSLFLTLVLGGYLRMSLIWVTVTSHPWNSSSFQPRVSSNVLKISNHTRFSGPDNVPTRLLIMVAEEIAPMLTTIFQILLDTATVPSDLREALITPLYKKGPRYIPVSYRPVSLTSVVSKMFEHIIFSSSMKHLNSYKILTPSQHGFRSKTFL